MSKTMDNWFFMRPGFTTFRLEPDKHRHLLFGEHEREQRDMLLGALEGTSYSNDGYKAVVFGDYGRGKTHLCQNLAFRIQAAQMNVVPIYLKCSAYTSKEPFASLFRELVTRHPTKEMNRIAVEYEKLVQAGKARSIEEIVQSEDIAKVMRRGLTAVDEDAVRTSMRWLGGEAKVAMGLISQSLKPQLTDSREFGAVMKGLTQMFVTVDGKVPLYLIDEAERFENVAHADTFATWLAALREITEIVQLGLMFFVGAKSRNNLPTLLLQDEIIRRVGAANYIEFQNPSREQIREFLCELLSTAIQKGPVPEEHAPYLSGDALDRNVPEGLAKLTGGDPTKLGCFPFDADAFEEFVTQMSVSEYGSRPSAVLGQLQSGAQRTIRDGKRTIDMKIIEEIVAGGF